MKPSIAMNKVLIFVLFIFFLSCKEDTTTTLNIGTWRAEMKLSETVTLPFNFEVTSANSLKILNAEEVIFVEEITYRNDSVLIKMPAFDGHYIAARLTERKMEGVFVEESRERVVPFMAEFGVTNRFDVENKPAYTISGRWETIFSEGKGDDEYEAMGIFDQDGNKVTGTFRTTKGDYRYLEGVLDGEELKLSTFDGSHVFYYTAKVTDSSMSGMFYSGNHFKEPFVAFRNENFELEDPETITFIKEGYDRLEFSFPDASNNIVSLTDDRFKNKVVVVQLMGSWCPNCLDETKYYAEFYNSNRDKDIEFVALAFEYAKTEELAFKGIAKLKNDIGIEYPILLAQIGGSSKVKAQEKLPMLNHVWSYPTSIFIDKKGEVRKIHTGFNGPATGEKYEEFKQEFEAFVDELLAE